MIVADTHALIWWITDPSLLSAAARRRLDGESQIGVCTISFWEIATLAERGRITIDEPAEAWLKSVLALPQIVTLEITPSIGACAGRLPRSVGGDPVDRLIVATALERAVALVTKDGRIRESAVVETIW